MKKSVIDYEAMRCLKKEEKKNLLNKPPRLRPCITMEAKIYERLKEISQRENVSVSQLIERACIVCFIDI